MASKIKKINSSQGVLTDGTKILSKNVDLLDLFYNATKSALLNEPDKSNPLFGFVNNSFKNMSKMENEKGHIVLETLKQTVIDTDKYFKNKEKVDTGYYEYLLYKDLFDWQKQVFADKSKKITLLAGRRSGKSFSEAAIAVNHCVKGYDIINGFLKPRSVVIVGLTQKKCEKVFWQNIITYAKMVDENCNINNSELIVTFHNGATIELVGNSTSAEREKLRGGDFSLMIIDEAQSQNSLNYLCVDIFGPIAEARQSTMILSGTGSITPKGYWKRITTGDLSVFWKHYTATMEDNPTVEPGALKKVLKDNGWTEDNITYRREYLGENIIDTTRIVYPIFHNGENNRPVTRIVIGVDYGSRDSNTFVPLLLHSDGKIEVNYCRKFNRSSGQDIVSQGVELDKFLKEKYKVSDILFVADTSHQAISLDLYSKGLNIMNAYKFDRMQTIKDIRSELERGDIIINDEIVSDEMLNYVWKYNEEEKSVIYETDDEFYHPDALPALRYAYMALKNDRISELKGKSEVD